MARVSDQEDFQKTALRLPRDLHSKIIGSAKDNNRTMNAEIINRLERTFFEDYARLDESPTEAKDVDDLLTEINQKIEAVKLAVDRFEKLKTKGKD